MSAGEPAPLDEAALRVLCGIADEAGRAIMSVYAGEVTAWQKADASPLTEADLRADAIIRTGLERHFPGVFILSEESSSGEHGNPRTFFLVDPLDGTKEFLKRNGEFTVNIAFVQDGAPVAGVVLAPALDALFYGVRGGPARRRTAEVTTEIRVAPRPAGEPLRVVASRSHGDDSLARWLAQAGAHTVVPVGSSLKFCRIAEGLADVYPRFGPTSQWDTAAAQAVLEIAGGVVVGVDGAPVRYGLSRPILNPHFIAAASPRLLTPAS
ncbi:MAG: 3'(2'),5'-bisphosphate nucleotidase CysQ [Vicinamibacterales bacterium]